MPPHQGLRMNKVDRECGLGPQPNEPGEDQTIRFGKTGPLRCVAPKDLYLMPQRQILHMQVCARSQAENHLSEGQSKDIDHAIKIRDLGTKAQKFRWNSGFEESHPNKQPSICAWPCSS